MRSRGGAAGWSAGYVSIREARASLDTNDFVLERTHGHEVCLRWTSDTRLLVEVPPDASVLRQVESSHDIEISYAVRDLAAACEGCGARLGDEWIQCRDDRPAAADAEGEPKPRLETDAQKNARGVSARR